MPREVGLLLSCLEVALGVRDFMFASNQLLKSKEGALEG
jgi:hypothetical protein